MLTQDPTSSNDPRDQSKQTASGSQLEVMLPDWCILSWRHCLLCVAFTLLFAGLNYLPLGVSSSWHDIWTGNWIANNGVYDIDPSTPLADGKKQEVHGWLGRVLIANAFGKGNLEFLSLIFSFSQTIMAGIWALLFVRLSGRWWAGLLPVLMVVLCYWHLDGISIRSLGQLCFAALALILFTQRSPGGMLWKATGVSLLMTAWVNLDQSWPVGILLLATLAVGQVVETLTTKQAAEAQRLAQSAALRSAIVLLECGLLATLVNPFGLWIWKSLFNWGDASFWAMLGGWEPLQLISFPTLALGVALVIWLCAFRRVERVAAWNWILVLVAMLLAGCSATSVSWAAPMVLLSGFWMLGNDSSVAAVCDNRVHNEETRKGEAKPLEFAWTLMCGLAIWVGFAFSPSSHFLLGGNGRTSRQLLGQANAVAAMQQLQQQDSEGLLWCPSYWSDRLLAIGNVQQVFANQDSSRLPAQVRHDYELLYRGQSGWRKILNRYAVSRLLIDKQHQKRMLHNLRASTQDWIKVHEDQRAVIYQRKPSASGEVS